MTTNLNLPQVAGNQNSKFITINDATGGLDAALTAPLAANVTSTNVLTLTSAQFRGAFFITVDEDGADPATAAITLTVPAVSRGNFEIINATAFPVTVTVAAQPVAAPVVATGETVLMTCDGVNVKQAGGGGGGSALTVEDEGTPLSTAVTKFNFAGAGVTVTEPVTDEMLVTIPGGGSGSATTVNVAADAKFSPPLISDFPTWVNQQAGVAADSMVAGFTLVDLTTSTGGDQIIARVKPIPTGSWTAIYRLRATFKGDNFNNVGFVIRDSATDRTTLFRINHESEQRLSVSNFIAQAFSAHLYSKDMAAVGYEWFKVEDDTTNFKFSISRDGELWIELVSTLRTAFLAAPDQIGFYVDPEQSAGVAISVPYYDDKDTPASTSPIATVVGQDTLVGFRGVLVELTSVFALTASANSNDAISWDQAAYDTNFNGSAFAEFVTNPTRITIPTGVTKVRFRGSAFMDVDFAVGDLLRGLILHKNGSELTAAGTLNTVRGNEAQLKTSGSSAVLEVVAGDYFELIYHNEDTTTQNLSVANTWFSMEVVEFDSAAFTFSPYDVDAQFSTTPTTSQVFRTVPIVRDIAIPADFAGSFGTIGTNPTASFAIDVTVDAVTIGTITVSTGGVVTFATLGNVDIVIQGGSILRFVAPSVVDATAADLVMGIAGIIR